MKIVDAMKQVDSWGQSKAVFVLYKDKDFVITIAPGAVERRFDYAQRDKKGNPRDTWTFSQATLSGELEESYAHRGEKALPTVNINLRSAELDRFNDSRPIWKPEQKERAGGLTSLIAAALR